LIDLPTNWEKTSMDAGIVPDHARYS